MYLGTSRVRKYYSTTCMYKVPSGTNRASAREAGRGGGWNSRLLQHQQNRKRKLPLMGFLVDMMLCDCAARDLL